MSEGRGEGGEGRGEGGAEGGERQGGGDGGEKRGRAECQGHAVHYSLASVESPWCV